MKSLRFCIFYFTVSLYLQLNLSHEVENSTEDSADEIIGPEDKIIMDDSLNETAVEFDYTLQNPENVTISTISQCAVDIIDKYSDKEFVWIENHHHVYRDEILQNTKKSFKIFSTYTPSLDIVKFAVITLNNPYLDQTMLTQLQLLAILIIFTGDDTQLLLENLWKWNYNKVAVITKNMSIIGYPDFELKDCERVIYTRVFDQCGNSAPDGLFKFERVRDYKGCKVKFIANIIVPYIINPYDLSNPGYEILTLLDIARSLNITVDFVKHNFTDWGLELQNGTYTKMYGLLKERKVDYIIGMIFANESYLKTFQCTHPHTLGHIAFYLPAASLLEPWKNLVLIFDPYLWYSVLSTIFVVVLTWWIFGKVLKEEYQQFSYAFTQVWSVFLFVSVNKPHTRLMKTLFMLWIFFSFIVNSIYQGVLISFLTKPTYEHQIDSIEEMVEVKFPRGGFHSLAFLFKSKESSTDWDIYKNFIKCDLSIKCINRTAFQRDMATFKNLKQIRYEIPKYYLDKNGRCVLHELKPSSFYWIWMATYKGNHLYESINAVVFRMLQNGLIVKYVLDLQMKPAEVTDMDIEPLTLKHLQAAFYLVAMGLGLSVVVFGIEIVWHRKCR